MTEAWGVVTVQMKAPKKSRPKKIRPLDYEFFQFAEQVAQVFDRPEAAHLRTRLFQEATTLRNRYYPRRIEDRWATKAKWIAFLLRMILTCPQILSRPPDFEWVMDDLEWILTRRKLHPGYDRDFWDAVDRIRVSMRTGHPRDKALDYFRFETVQSLMNPPAQLKDFVKTSSKSEAVERAADMEGNLFGERPHERVIYRSLKRVEKELKEVNDLLQAKSSHSPPPTQKLDSEPEPRAKKSKKRTTSSTRPKRVRRK